MQFTNGLEMALLQPLYKRFQHRPSLLEKLQTQLGLRKVSGQGQAMLATPILFEMLELLYAEREPHISAWLAMQTDLSAGGGIAYYLRSCATLDASINEIQRLRSRLLPDGELNVEWKGPQLRISLRPRYQTQRLGRLLRYEGILGWIVQLLNHCVENPVRPSTVEFMTPETHHSTQLVQLFGTLPRFSMREFAVCYPSELLSRPLPGSNPDLLAALRPSLDYMLPSIRNTVSATQQLREWLRSLSHAGQATQSNAARAFNCGASSLRRRLAEEGNSFSSLLQAERRARALKWVVSSEDTIEAIATHMGYTDRTTLERAFLGWFTYRPVQLRSELEAAWPDSGQRNEILKSVNTLLPAEDSGAWLKAATVITPRPSNGLDGSNLAALLMCVAGVSVAAIRRMRSEVNRQPIETLSARNSPRAPRRHHFLPVRCSMVR